MDNIPHSQGFTISQVAVVLVFIGLCIGGVMLWKTMTYAARMKMVGTELHQLSLAVTEFRLKFNCLPGDCENATQFFGTSRKGCPPMLRRVRVTEQPAKGMKGAKSKDVFRTVSSTRNDPLGNPGTCNGNGDGFVEAWHDGDNGQGGKAIEALYGMQQLGLAHLISGSYAGGNAQKLGGESQNLAASHLVPVSMLTPDIGYYLFTIDPKIIRLSTLSERLMVQIGALTVDKKNDEFLWGAGFTGPEAKALDKKIDDGLPNEGQLQSTDAKGPSRINPNSKCLKGREYLTSVNSGCTMYLAPDVP